MTRYLLDTDALIDFSKGAQPATSSILSWIDGDDTVALCPISVAEFYAGLTTQQASHWKRFIVSLPYWEVSLDAAMQAGQFRYAHAGTGYHITTADALVGAVALEHVATLVTGNAKHFPMKGLSLHSLR